MGRRSKQRALLKANRMVPVDVAKQLFDKVREQSGSLIFHLPSPINIKQYPNIASLNPFDLKDFLCEWIMLFEREGSDFNGIVYFDKDFSEGFAIAYAKKGSSDGLGFEDMFGLSYQQIIEQAFSEAEKYAAILSRSKVYAVA